MVASEYSLAFMQSWANEKDCCFRCQKKELENKLNRPRSEQENSNTECVGEQERERGREKREKKRERERERERVREGCLIKENLIGQTVLQYQRDGDQ